MKHPICGVISHSGPNREPLACAYAPDHDGAHSWATLPTFVDGRQVDEMACRICGAGHDGTFPHVRRMGTFGSRGSRKEG